MKLPNTFHPFLRLSLFLLFFSPSIKLSGQKTASYRIAFYNLENLFHPDNDSTKSDDDFTPEGPYNWNEFRYREKCNRMAKAILSIGEWQPPAIVGVAEIENRQALQDLVSTDVLRKFGYKIIHYESPDNRGIDVAMLYRSEIFTSHYSKAIRVSIPENKRFKTRDILYVKGSCDNSDTLHLFFNHWPSRYGGQAASEPKRIRAAVTLRKAVDSIQKLGYTTNIIIAGDFNDEWSNISLKDSLQAKPIKELQQSSLINLMASMPMNMGSHRYRGTWSYLDQIIVSNSLLSYQGTFVVKNSAWVVEHPFLLETDERYPGKVPFRTFVGRRYNGGFSDHLPIYIDISFR